jgi:hypothetical protein
MPAMPAPRRQAIARTAFTAFTACAAFTMCAALTACDRRAPLASCDDDLRGVYVAGNERWMLLDNGPTLEAYPLFTDGDIKDDLVAAPRVIDLERDARPGDSPPGDSPPGESRGRASGVRGTMHQRFMRRAERCDASVPVEVTRCAGDRLELVLADPSPPIAFAPCAWAQLGPSRIVRWRRE